MGAPVMDNFAAPTEEEQAQLMALLQAYEQGAIGANDVPDDLKELLANVQRVKGQPTETVDAEEVIPQPCFVVKTSDVPTSRKVFVNICSSDAVPPPSGWDRGASMPVQVSAALDRMQTEMSATDTEALRFPLSCGDLRPDTDRSGGPCLIVDCIFNSDVAAAAGRSRPLQAFLVELALGWVGDKHKLDLDLRFKLPKMAYKGLEVAVQRVRKPRAPLVTEVTGAAEVTAGDDAPSFALPLATGIATGGSSGRDGSSTGSKAVGAAGSSKSGSAALHGVGAQSQEQQRQGQQHSAAGPAGTTSAAGTAAATARPALQHSIQYEGRPVTALLVVVQLPPGFKAPDTGFSKLGASPGSVARPAAGLDGAAATEQVSVSGRQLSINLPGCQLLNVLLPFAVTAAGATATMSDDHRSLQLRLPYLPLAQLVERMEHERPHSYGELGLNAESYMELET